MFPLGVVHFPHVFLPLQIFEPRYRQLTLDCLDRDREFGVVLIERGSEVGGGDSRFDVGTMTIIIEAGFNERGMIRLDTVGVRRIRVLRWLDDDPYPRAETEDMAAPAMGESERAAFEAAEIRVRRALALRAELDEPAVGFNTRLDDDPARALFQLAAIAPVGPADQQVLLAAERPLDLLDRLVSMMDEELVVLASRLSGN